MTIPVGVLAVGSTVKYRNEVDAAFRQATRQQQALSESMAAVSIAQPLWFSGKIEQPAHVGRTDELEGAGSVVVPGARDG